MPPVTNTHRNPREIASSLTAPISGIAGFSIESRPVRLPRNGGGIAWSRLWTENRLKSFRSVRRLYVNTAETQAVSIEPTASEGVTGWLLCLCLLLTFVYPARTLYHILAYTLPTLFSGHGFKLIFLLSVYSIVFISLAVLSFIAGLKLWLVRPGAVIFARR